MSKNRFRRIVASVAMCALAFPLAACSSDKAEQKLTLEVCQEKQKNDSYKNDVERQKCEDMIEEDERQKEEERREKEEKEEKERLAKIEESRKNLAIENFRADYERGAFVIAMDIKNNNKFAVGDVTVTIPYGERWQDNYGDTQIEKKNFEKTIDMIPADESRSIKIFLGGNYAKEKLEPIDEQSITLTTSGETTNTAQKNGGLDVNQFEINFFSDDSYDFEMTVTNNSSRKIESITFTGIKVDADDAYSCNSDEAECDPRDSFTVEYLKPGATSERQSMSYRFVDLEITDVAFGD